MTEMETKIYEALKLVTESIDKKREQKVADR
jgi:hypothetical protein